MLMPALLLFALGLHWVTPMCFLNKIAAEKRREIGHRKVVDQSHCQILCAENSNCRAFTFHRKDCILLGESISFYTDSVCPEYEWVKMENSKDCPVDTKPPKMDAMYVPNPRLSRATQVENRNAGFIVTEACPGGNVVDVVHSDNSRSIHGNFLTWIQWDRKFGSWMFTRMMFSDATKKPVNTTFRIRGARCYNINPNDFADTTSCGGKIPTMPAHYSFTSAGPVLRYGVTNCCSSELVQICPVFAACSSGYHASSDRSYITCVDGSWIHLCKYPQSKTLGSYQITKAICMQHK